MMLGSTNIKRRRRHLTAPITLHGKYKQRKSLIIIFLPVHGFPQATDTLTESHSLTQNVPNAEQIVSRLHHTVLIMWGRTCLPWSNLLGQAGIDFGFTCPSSRPSPPPPDNEVRVPLPYATYLHDHKEWRVSNLKLDATSSHIRGLVTFSPPCILHWIKLWRWAAAAAARFILTSCSHHPALTSGLLNPVLIICVHTDADN